MVRGLDCGSVEGKGARDVEGCGWMYSTLGVGGVLVERYL